MIKDDIKGIAIPILKKYGVKKASLFGSFVRGEETPQSDIDMLVQFEEGKSLLDLIGLEMELEETFQRKFDVITYKSVHHLLRNSILGEQEIFYEETTDYVS